MQNPDNLPATTQPETAPATTGLKGKLKSLFNLKSIKGFARAAAQKTWDNKYELGINAALGAAVKVTVLSCTASVATSAIGVLAVGAGVGATTALIRHGVHLTMAKDKAERDSRRLSNKDLFKKMLWGASFGALGSGMGMGLGTLHTHLTNGCFNKFSTWKDMFITSHKSDMLPSLEGLAHHAAPSVLHDTPPIAEMAGAPHVPPVAAAPQIADATPAAPTPAAPDVSGVTAAAAVPAPAPATPLDAIKDYAAHHKVSAKLKDALLRAESGSAHVRAQALDDIAVYAPKDMHAEAYELLKKSAEMGNVKAKTDLAEMLFNGDKSIGLKADEDAAISSMKELAKRSPRAAKILESWIGNPPPESVRELVRQAHEAAVTPAAPATTPDIAAPSVAPEVPVAPAPVEVPVETPVDVAPAAEVGAAIAEPDVVATPLPTDPAPVAPALPQAATQAVVKSAPDCKGIVDIFSNAIRFICKVGADDTTFEIGDRVTIQRPALLVPSH